MKNQAQKKVQPPIPHQQKNKNVMRLQKYIAQCTAFSRRKAEELIIAGRVNVNGTVIKKLGTTIDTTRDSIFLDGKKLTPHTTNKYILLHKPAGFLSTKADTHGRKTVCDLVNDRSLYPVGRLDKDTEGLLILTNDGNFAYQITHPKFEHDKEYYVELKNELSLKDAQKLSKGITIDGKKTAPAEIKKIMNIKHKHSCHIIIHEGRKRQIKRMFEEIGNRVIYLKRLRIGSIKLGEIPKGKTRVLTQNEINSLLHS